MAHVIQHMARLANTSDGKPLLRYILLGLTVIFIVIFSLSGIAYGASYSLHHAQYNMVTGCPNDGPCAKSDKLFCYNEFNGCFLIGFFSFTMILIIILFLSVCYSYYVKCTAPILSYDSSGNMNYQNAQFEVV